MQVRNLIIFCLFISSASNAQKVDFTDFTDLLKNRRDTNFIISSLTKKGFTGQGMYNDSTLVFYSEKSKDGNRFSEQVILYYTKGQMDAIEYNTDFHNNYDAIKSAIIKTSGFLWLPMEHEPGEIHEGFSSAKYLVTGSSKSKQKSFRLLISLRPADSPFPFTSN